MTPHFWLWLLYFIVIVFGGFRGYGQRGTNQYWFGVPLLLALFLFVVCWAIAGNPLTVLVPNLAVFERANIVQMDGYVHSAPELVVEISTRGKISDYESLGVPELWVLSPEARSVEIMQLSADQRLETVAIVNQGQIHPKLFPQVGVDVTSIWPR